MKGTVCPVCAEREVLAGHNDLATTDNQLLGEWDYEQNKLMTTEVSRTSAKRAYASGITQNVDDLLQSHTARTMLANSEFIIMLNQASTDRLELAKLLNISDLQMSYIRWKNDRETGSSGTAFHFCRKITENLTSRRVEKMIVMKRAENHRGWIEWESQCNSGKTHCSSERLKDGKCKSCSSN